MSRRVRPPDTRAYLVDGQFKSIAEIRSGAWHKNAVRWLNSLGIDEAGDYSPDRLAQAYKTGMTAYICTTTRAGLSSEIPVRVMQGPSAKYDPDAAVEATTSPAQFFVDNSQRLIWRAVASYLIWGCAYFMKIRNKYGYPTGLRWMSPMEIEPDIDDMQEKVRGYRWYRRASVKYIDCCDMIADYTFNPNSDIDGTSILEVAMTRSGIETNIAKFGAAFFANSARPDGLLSYDGELDEEEQKDVRTYWDNLFKGAVNAFKTAILGGGAGGKWSWTPVNPAPSDLAMVDLTNQADVKICSAFRVNPALAGLGTVADMLSAQNTFENIRQAHINDVSVPDVKHICSILQEQWLDCDFVGSAYKWVLEPDLTEITSNTRGTADRTTTAQTAVTSHVWTVNEGRNYTGREPLKDHIDLNPDWATSVYQTGGITLNEYRKAIGREPLPIPEGDMLVWQLDPRQKGGLPGGSLPMLSVPYQLLLQGGTQDGVKDSPFVSTESLIDVQAVRQSEACYALLMLTNNSQLISLQTDLKAQLPAADWSDPSSFHITLAFAPTATDLDLLRQVLPKSINPLQFRAGPLSAFDSDGDTPLVLPVETTPALLALHESICAAFKAIGLQLSEYTLNWKPHITLGYRKRDDVQPTSDVVLDLVAHNIEVSVEEGNSFKTVYVTRSKEAEIAQLHDLGLWRQKVKNHGRDSSFTSEVIPPDIQQFVRQSLDEYWYAPSVFQAASEWVRTGNPPAPLGAKAEEAGAYWHDYEGLQHDLGAAWLEYQRGLANHLTDNGLPAGSFERGHAALMREWVGDEKNPGVLTKLLVAGEMAGEKMLQRNAGIAPPPARADIGVNWSLVNLDAVNFARNYSYSLIKDLDATTTQLLSEAHQRSIEDGLGRDATADLFKAVLGGERASNRATLVAQTEGVRAYNEGAFNRWQSAGVTEAEWQTVRDSHVCPYCNSVHGMRADIKTGWRSDVDGKVLRPPRHPGCRCFTKPILGALSVPEDQRQPLAPPVSPMGIPEPVQQPETQKIHRVFENKYEANEYTDMVSVDWKRSLSDEEVRSLTDYQENSAFGPANNYLRGIKSDLPANLQQSKFIDNMDSAIKKNTVKDDMIGYRGVRGWPEFYDRINSGDLSVGSEYTDKGYHSVTLDKEVASDYSDVGKTVQITVKIPAGSNAAYMSSYKDRVYLRNEAEVVLPRDSTFKIVSVDSKPDDKVQRITVEYIAPQPAGAPAPGKAKVTPASTPELPKQPEVPEKPKLPNPVRVQPSAASTITIEDSSGAVASTKFDKDVTSTEAAKLISDKLSTAKHKVTVEDVLTLTGGGVHHSDASYEINQFGGKVTVRVKSKDGLDYLKRTLYRDDQDNLVISNDVFEIDQSKQGKGIGSETFYNQVANAQQLGVKKIVTHAVKDVDMNGYYTWPRLGYDAPVPKELIKAIPDNLIPPNIDRKGMRISDLMKTPEGRAWWSKEGDTVDLEFDPTPGSQSMRVLESYMQERAKRKNG